MDLEVAIDLTEEDLEEMGVLEKGRRKRVLAALRAHSADDPGSPPVLDAAAGLTLRSPARLHSAHCRLMAPCSWRGPEGIALLHRLAASPARKGEVVGEMNLVMPRGGDRLPGA